MPSLPGRPCSNPRQTVPPEHAEEARRSAPGEKEEIQMRAKYILGILVAMAVLACGTMVAQDVTTLPIKDEQQLYEFIAGSTTTDRPTYSSATLPTSQG